MADYKVVDTEKLESELTGMADEVRTLAATDSKMSLEAMTDNVAQANSKVDSQTDLIAQIKRTLQGKAGSGGGLPDWDDDSPIIASGYGYGGYTTCTWEITEKGTMRWKYNPNGTGYGAYAKSAGWGNSVLADSAPKEVRENYLKVKQLYVPDEFETVYLGYLTSCERVRLPKNLRELNLSYFTSLKEVEDCCVLTTTSMRYSVCVSIEKITLSEERTNIPHYLGQQLYNLKEVTNIENITTFGNSCFYECSNYTKDLIFNQDLVSIGMNSFARCSSKIVKFQNKDTLPTIANNAFANCKELTNIYCPWAEGEVANAPWGATKATIHYNTQYDENGNVIE